MNALEKLFEEETGITKKRPEGYDGDYAKFLLLSLFKVVGIQINRNQMKFALCYEKTKEYRGFHNEDEWVRQMNDWQSLLTKIKEEK